MDSSVPPPFPATGTLAELGPDGSAVVLCDDGSRRGCPAGSRPPGACLRVGQRVRVLDDGDRVHVELWEPSPVVHPTSRA